MSANFDTMNKFIVSMVDEAYRRARASAAEAGKSVLAMVRAFLNSLRTEETHFGRRKREESDLRAKLKHFCASDRLSRDDVHERRR